MGSGNYLLLYRDLGARPVAQIGQIMAALALRKIMMLTIVSSIYPQFLVAKRRQGLVFSRNSRR